MISFITIYIQSLHLSINQYKLNDGDEELVLKDYKTISQNGVKKKKKEKKKKTHLDPPKSHLNHHILDFIATYKITI